MIVLRVALVALAGVPAGWFAGLLVDRIPDDQPLWRPRPGLPWPGDGSRYRYVVVMLLVVALFAGAAVRFDEPAQLVPFLGLFTVLVALSVIDIGTLRLPDRLVFPSLIASLVILPVASLALGDLKPLLYAAFGGIFYFLFLFLAFLIYPRGMGFGDVKLSLLMGMYVGWLATDGLSAVALVLYAMLGGFVLGTVAGIAVLIARNRSAEYPFGPFLAAGTVIVVLLSDSVLAR